MILKVFFIIYFNTYFILQVAVNQIVEGTTVLVGQIKEHLMQRVIDCMDENAEDLTTECVEQVLGNFEDPFLNLKTTYLQSSFVVTNYNFVKPVQYVLSTKIAYRNKGLKRQICQQDDTFVYIPILDSLQQLLSNSSISDIIMVVHHIVKTEFCLIFVMVNVLKTTQSFKSTKMCYK